MESRFNRQCSDRPYWSLQRKLESGLGTSASRTSPESRSEEHTATCMRTSDDKNTFSPIANCQLRSGSTPIYFQRFRSRQSGAWLSWLERRVHIAETVGSSPTAPISPVPQTTIVRHFMASRSTLARRCLLISIAIACCAGAQVAAPAPRQWTRPPRHFRWRRADAHAGGSSSDRRLAVLPDC